jgi:hypothetical protein
MNGDIYNGSGVVRIVRAAWPFSSVRIYPDSFVLRCMRTDYRVQKNDIQEFTYFRVLFGQFELTAFQNDTTTKMIFTTFSPRPILQVLEACGYSYQAK